MNEIKINSIPNSPMDRASSHVVEILASNNFCIDSHVHLFDIKCINKSYFILRVIKDLLELKFTTETYSNFSVQKAYDEVYINEDGWEDSLGEELGLESGKIIAPDTKGVIR